MFYICTITCELVSCHINVVFSLLRRYTSTGTYIKPAASATPAASSTTTYVVDTSALQYTTQTWTQAASSGTYNYPGTATTGSYQTQSTGGATTGSGSDYYSQQQSAGATQYQTGECKSKISTCVIRLFWVSCLGGKRHRDSFFPLLFVV